MLHAEHLDKVMSASSASSAGVLSRLSLCGPKEPQPSSEQPTAHSPASGRQ